EECRWRIARHTLLRTVRFGPLRRAARCNHSDHFSIAAPSSQIGLVGCIQVCMDLASKLLSGAYVGSRRGLKDEGGGICADMLGNVCRAWAMPCISHWPSTTMAVSRRCQVGLPTVGVG